jgi:opacity protein-like surface antigen
MYWKVLSAVLFLCASSPAHSQVVPPAETPGLPLTVGIGYSNFYSDWSGRISGVTAWIDFDFYRAPSYLRGLAVEAEGRDLSFGLTGTDPKLRFDTIAGGALYKVRLYPNFHPYAKFLFGFGSMDFTTPSPTYSHDTRFFLAPGGGLDYRLTRAIWLRGDYEYQFWTDYFRKHALNPNGITVGAFYNFHRTW